jgi:hypothetical protein
VTEVREVTTQKLKQKNAPFKRTGHLKTEFKNP